MTYAGASEAAAAIERASSGHARIAIVIPCFNEELTIEQVVRDFRTALPSSDVYVFDNNSSDQTAELARRSGAIVRHEARQGKGFVVQSIFRTVEADIYVMVDGDATYPASEITRLIEPIARGEADMVIGSRLHSAARSDFRLLNRLGNMLYVWLLRYLFRVKVTDLLSGYRAFSRSLVRGVPLFGGGFQTEAELTIKAAQRGFRIAEVPVDLIHRPAGSHSKIRVVRDGLLILNAMLTLARDYKPLTVFGALGLACIVLGGVPLLVAMLDGSLASRPAQFLIFSAVSMVTGFGLCGIGLLLHTVARHFQEVNLEMQYLHDEIGRSRTRAD